MTARYRFYWFRHRLPHYEHSLLDRCAARCATPLLAASANAPGSSTRFWTTVGLTTKFLLILPSRITALGPPPLRARTAWIRFPVLTQFVLDNATAPPHTYNALPRLLATDPASSGQQPPAGTTFCLPWLLYCVAPCYYGRNVIASHRIIAGCTDVDYHT